MDRIISRFLLIGLSLFFLNSNAAGRTYPAQGHFDPREGTLEIWFTIDGEPGEPNESPLFLFHFTLENQYSLVISYNASNQRLTARPAEANPTGRRRMMNNLWEQMVLQKGRRYHLAMTWRGAEMMLYLDGKSLGGRTQAMGFTGPVGKAEFFLGDPQGQINPVTFQAVKLSDRALVPEEVAESQPAADIHTLFLDDFEFWPLGDAAETRAPQIQAGYHRSAHDH